MTSLEHWWHDIDRGEPKYSENNLSSATFSTTYLTWNVLGPRSEGPLSSRLSHCTAVKLL